MAVDPEAARDAAPVRVGDLERELAWLAAEVERPEVGAFGPDSATWQVDREAALFLGAARALLLQLAHPWVGAAVAAHSHALRDPIGRFHRTFGAVHAMVFGPLPQALAAARRLHRRHASVRGTLPRAGGRHAAGEAYRANEVGALRWVHATLVDSAVLAHDALLPPLSPARREDYWHEARRFAAFFGIPQAALPGDWRAFRAWFEATAASDALAVGDDARRVAAALLDLGAGGEPRGRWPPGTPGWLATLTADWLPAPVRDGFGLAPTAGDRAGAARCLAALRGAYRLTPSALRHVGPWHEARARLAGRAPGPLVRASNRIWIGRPGL